MVTKSPKRNTRARSDDDKGLRRSHILSVALELWRETDYASVTMSGVAARADLAKGTLYLYFQTKEELFLALLGDLLGHWFESVQAQLERATATNLAELLTRSLESSEDMVRLLSILSTVLESNASQAAVLEFKTRLALQSALVGEALERILGLEPGGGTRLLLLFNALTIGLYQMSRPVAGVSDAPHLKNLSVNFALELRSALEALIRGFSSSDLRPQTSDDRHQTPDKTAW